MEVATLKMFRALPPYFGGKRRLVGEIFRHIPPSLEAPVFVDAFLGGGSVSLFAKARGFEVVANDIATRSAVVGRALIENSENRLVEEDLLRLFVPNAEAKAFVASRFSPGTFTSRCAQFLDLAVVNARRVPEPKRSLLLLALVKFAFRCRPHGNFGARSIVFQIEEGRWDEVNPAYAREHLNRRINSHPIRAIRAIADEINAGVFSNGKRNQVHQRDAAEFLSTVEGDVAYLDPPYASTTSYESALRVIDSMLAGEDVRLEMSAFSARDASGAVDHLLDSARHIRRWIISYGNAAVSLSEFSALVARHRPVIFASEIAYRHCMGLANEETSERNREFIVVAERKGS